MGDLTQPFIADFAAERRTLSHRLGEYVDGLPAMLRDCTLRVVEQHGLGTDELAWPSIYFLFPFWAHVDLGGGVTSLCSDVAYANGALVYSVLLQDEAIDVLNDESAEQVMAANAFLVEACRTYDALFGNDERFWRPAVDLLHDGWAALAAERREHRRPSREMLERDRALQEAKANPGKVAALGICLLLERPHEVKRLAQYLSHWQAGCQMLDDLEDFREDLQAGNFTQLLVLAGAVGSCEEAAIRTEMFVGSGGLREYFERARTHYEAALSASPRSNGHLSEHMRELLCELAARRILYERMLELSSAS